MSRTGKDGLPEVEMGIGIHTGQVVVGQYRLGRADEIRRGGKPRQSDLAHPVLHHGRPDPRLRDDPAGGRQQCSRSASRWRSGQRASSTPWSCSRPWVSAGRISSRSARASTRSIELEEEIPLRYEVVEFEPGRRRSIEGRVDQGVAEGRRGKACKSGRALEQSQDASHRRRRRADSRHSLRQGSGSRPRNEHWRLLIRFTSISPEI